MICCESCNSSGEVMYSCCTGDIIEDDMAICPTCYEHLGDEECYDCRGTVSVTEGTESTPKIPGLQAIAENYMDSLKDGL